MRRWAFILCALGTILALGSCKRADDTTAGGTSAPGGADSAALKEILDYQKATGATLDSLSKEVERRKALDEAQAHPAPLENDLQVARLLITGAQTSAQNKAADDTAASLRRLERMLIGILAELPATEMGIDLERALYSLKQETGAGAIAHASGALLLAVNVSVKATLPTLVPTVVKDIEAAKALVDKGDTQGAIKAIADLIGKVGAHPSTKSVSYALDDVRGAEEALARQAWPVVIAELQQVDSLFAELVKSSQSAPAGATAQPAAEQPAAQSAEPTAATGEAPAAQSTAPAETQPQQPAAAAPAPAPAPQSAAAPGSPSAKKK